MEIYWIFLEILLTCIANLGLYSVWGEMVTPSRYHNIGSSDYNQTPSLPPTSTLLLSQSAERRLCPLCSVVTTLSGACLFVYLISNLISYYWRQCTPNTWYMPCPPESSHWNTESCLYGSAVAHEETEGESLEHWDTDTITWPLHPVTRPAVDIPACSATLGNEMQRIIA